MQYQKYSYTVSKNTYIQYQVLFSFFTIKTKKEQANESVPEKYEPKKFLKPKRNKQ